MEIKEIVLSFIKSLQKKLLDSADCPQHAERMAWWLLEKATHQTKINLMIEGKKTLSPEQEKILNEWVTQITVYHKPIQYVLGSLRFCTITVDLQPPTLIPRPETEEWCTALIDFLKPYTHLPLRILDMCTGTGALTLALAKALPQATVLGVDISSQAIELARHNLSLNALSNAQFIVSDLFSSLPSSQKFDIIISNPPYVTESDWETMSPTITKWEDKKAFVARNNGLEFYENIVRMSHHFLASDAFLKKGTYPHLVFEIGHTQKDDVVCLLKAYKFSNIKIHNDFRGKTRSIWASL